MRVEEETTMGSIVARRYTSYQPTNSQVERAEQKLRNLDHYFYNGKLYEIGTRKPFTFNYYANHSQNQQRYERLGKAVEEYVYAILQSEGGLKKVNLPFGETNYSGSDSFIFHSPDLQKKEKILVLMHGSGVVRAGQWSRRLIINESMDAGSMLPYIEAAKNCGYGVVVLNTNQNEIRAHHMYRSYNSSPESHFKYVWQQLIEKLNRPVAIVTHSYGGSVVMEAAKSIQGFMEQTFAVALTDCWVSDSPRIQSWLRKKVCNWVTSRKPLGEVINPYSTCKTFSGGTTVHEETPWKAFSHILDFILDSEQNCISPDLTSYYALIGQHRKNTHVAGLHMERVANNHAVNLRNCHRNNFTVPKKQAYEQEGRTIAYPNDHTGLRRDNSRDRYGNKEDFDECSVSQRGRSKDRRGVSEDRDGAKANERGRSKDRRGISEDRDGAKANERGISKDRRGISGDRDGAKANERGRSKDSRGVSGDRDGAKANERGRSKDRRGDRENNRVVKSVQTSSSFGRKRSASYDSRYSNDIRSFEKLSLNEAPLKKPSLNILLTSTKSYADTLKKNKTEKVRQLSNRQPTTPYKLQPPYATQSKF